MVVSDATTGRRRREVGGIRRNVALRREAVAVAAAIATPAQELHGVGDDLDRLALAGAVRGVPLAPVKPAVDGDAAALLEVLGAVLALRAPDRHVEVVRLVDPLPGSVLTAGVDGNAQLADGRPTRGGTEFRVLGQIARNQDSVDVRCGHWYSSLFVRGRSLLRSGEATDGVGSRGRLLTRKSADVAGTSPSRHLCCAPGSPRSSCHQPTSHHRPNLKPMFL